MKYFAGIGSREAPGNIQLEMVKIAKLLHAKGYGLRTGGAPGSDTAFAMGMPNATDNTVIYLPWEGYKTRCEGTKIVVGLATPEYRQIARESHKCWSRCTEAMRKLHYRNIPIILGMPEDNDPSEFVVCWTPGGKCVGGTAVGIQCALDRRIPVFNLATRNWGIAPWEY